MERIAVISDIHSEAPALAAVEEAMTSQGITRAWCLGDSVDWLLPRDPALRGHSAALRRVRALCEEVLIGNHESELLADPAGRTQLEAEPGGDDLLRYLDGLSPYRELPGIALVHGSPVGPLWSAVETEEDARQSFARSGAWLILCGHTHLPYLASCDAQGRVEVHRLPHPGVEQRLDPARRWLVNPGAVGRAPVEGLASWAVLTLDENGAPLSVSWQLTGFARPPRLFG